MEQKVLGESVNNKIEEEGRFYKFKLLYSRIKHGLFLLTLRNLLARTGLNLNLYYWVQEATTEIDLPRIKESEKNFEFKVLSTEDIKSLKNLSHIDVEERIRWLENGLKFVGIKTNGQVAAFMCIVYNDFVHEKKMFTLKKEQAYLRSMYTYQNYRGLNLAPYLRYKSYQLLRAEGINEIYSITDYFNKSSQKFKSKLNAKPLTLYFSIALFKRYHKTIKIKDYNY